MKGYKVVVGRDMIEFQNEVIVLLSDGWELHGGMNHSATPVDNGMCIEYLYSQALTKGR